MKDSKKVDPSVAQSIRDKNANYDIDGVTYWDGHVVVANSKLSKKISTKDVTGSEARRQERYPATNSLRAKK